MKREYFQNQNEPPVSLTEVILSWLLGIFGVHKFYRKKYALGILYLFTCGLFGLGWIYDSIALTVRYLSIKINDYPHESKAIEPVPYCTMQNQTQNDSQNVSDVPTHSCAVKKTHKVAGVSYYTENIIKLASENEDYNLTKRELVDEGLTDEKIWKYQFFPGETELIPEPDNPEDPNAIKVVVDGLKIGYIKAGSCSHVLKVLRENRCLGVDCEIYGGPYKIVYEDYDDEKDKDVYTMEKDEHSFAVTLTMYEK